MGSSQSKAQEPVIFYNPNVPLQFSQSLVGSLEKKVEQTEDKVEARQIESIVRERVSKELEKIKQAESKSKEKFYIELKDKNQQKENLESNAIATDIETMIKRISRNTSKELPEKVKEAQDQVVACYNNNKSKSLDCWKEVEQFKQAVAEEQKKFVAAHQK